MFSFGFGGAGRSVAATIISTTPPQDPVSLFGSALTLYLRSDSVSVSGSNVTGATDLSVSGLAFTPTGTVTRIASDTPPGGLDTPTIRFGSTGSRLSNAKDRGAPSGNPYWRFAVVKIASYVSGQRLMANSGASSNAHAIVHSTQSLGLAGVNSSGGNPSFGAPPGQWMLVMQQLCGANTISSRTQDWIWVRGLLQAGVNFGAATQRVGWSIGNGTNVDLKEAGEIDWVSTAKNVVDLIAYVAHRYGPDTVRCPIANSSRLFVYETQSNGESQGTSSLVGPGTFVHTVPLSAMTRTSPTADRNSCPLILRAARTRHSVAPIGKWGYEIQCVIDCLAAGHTPAAIIKNAFSSSSMVEALASPIYPLVTSHFAEFAGELNQITKCFLIVDRGNTDATQSISQATARTRFNDLFADRIALTKARCPNLTNSGIHLISNEISTNTSPGAAFIAGVNAGRLEALADQAALGIVTHDVTTSDLTLNGDNTHWGDAPNITIGSRHAAIINANW